MENIGWYAIRQVLLATAIVIFAFFQTAPGVLAADGNQSNNQDLSQSATLTAPDKNFQIDLYAQPNASSQQRIGYGLSGDRVTLLQQIGSNTGKIWNLVRFDNPPFAEGWVSQEFLTEQSTKNTYQRDRQKEGQKDGQKDGYLGYFGSQKQQRKQAVKIPSNQRGDRTSNQNQNQ